jgi:integrase/recombinase XerD
MRRHNPKNERIKHRYLIYLKEARGKSDQTIDAAARALSRFEASTKYRDFKFFRIEQAVAFKRSLAYQTSKRTGESLSKSTQLKMLDALRDFFRWLAREPGFRSRVSHSDADYFRLSEKDTRIAKATADKRVPSIDQISHTLNSMPSKTEIDLRNRAVIALCLLTGARNGAIASLKLKHLDVVEGKLVQDARQVKTKFSKTFTTWFFPVPDEVRQIVVDWLRFLTKEKLFGGDDPLFPATAVDCPHGRFAAVGLSRAHWSTTAPIRCIFKEAFARAGLPYANPHSFRDTLVQLGQRLCRDPEQFKAWSQNLGHESVLTTLSSYGQVRPERQAGLMKQLATLPSAFSPQDVHDLWRILKNSELASSRGCQPNPK